MTEETTPNLSETNDRFRLVKKLSFNRWQFSFLKSKKFLIILTICILILLPSSYIGASCYQSNKLIKEAEKLTDTGDYVGAISKYDQALKKWKWNSKKITPKKDLALDFQNQDKIAQEVEANFGAGEWQKCLDSLSKVEKYFPKYSQIKNRYSDCQKKLDEKIAVEAAAAAKAEADRLAAEAAAKSASKPATTKTPVASVDPYVNWKTYTSDKFGFSFKYPTKSSSDYGVGVILHTPKTDGQAAFVDEEINSPENNLADMLNIYVKDTTVPYPKQWYEATVPGSFAVGPRDTTQTIAMANGKTCNFSTNLGYSMTENDSLSSLSNHFIISPIFNVCITAVGKYQIDLVYAKYQYPNPLDRDMPYFKVVESPENGGTECAIDRNLQCSHSGRWAWTDALGFYKNLIAGKTKPRSLIWYRDSINIAKSVNF